MNIGGMNDLKQGKTPFLTKNKGDIPIIYEFSGGVNRISVAWKVFFGVSFLRIKTHPVGLPTGWRGRLVKGFQSEGFYDLGGKGRTRTVIQISQENIVIIGAVVDFNIVLTHQQLTVPLLCTVI